MCGRKPGSPGVQRQRAACRCSLPDFDRAQWDPSADKHAANDAEWRALELNDNAKAQGFDLDLDLDRDGCPRGWALSRFVSSVQAYAGRRGQDSPIRGLNPRLEWRIVHDSVMPTRLLDAVADCEAWEDGAWAFFHQAAAG